MKRLWLSMMFLAATGCQPDRGGTATLPIPQEVDRWERLHQDHLDQIRSRKIDLLFLGDSLTEMWSAPIWNQFYGSRNAANFGIGGDRTQHLLWRIDHGEVDGISPRIVVLQIGTNNLDGNSHEEIIEGIKAVVERLRGKLPASKILLLGVFPRGANRIHAFLQTHDEVDPDPRVPRLNAEVASLADGEKIRFLDLGKTFLSPSGKVTKTILPDFLHLSSQGYQLWAEAMEPTLWGMRN